MKQNKNQMAKKTETFNKKDIGNRLCDFRESHKWTQEAFCGQLAKYGLTYHFMQISNLENGNTSLKLDIMYCLHKYFHVDLNVLICGEEESNINGQALFDDLEALYKKYQQLTDHKKHI